MIVLLTPLESDTGTSTPTPVSAGTFWMVWRQDLLPNAPRTTPTVTHGSQERALAEAHRLATRHPDTTFIVLQATHAVRGTVRTTVRTHTLHPR